MSQDAEKVERGASEEGANSPLTPTEVEASRRPPSEPKGEQGPVAGDDVRPGPETTDEPLAGATEPTD
jgi:hypothetical protein